MCFCACVFVWVCVGLSRGRLVIWFTFVCRLHWAYGKLFLLELKVNVLFSSIRPTERNERMNERTGKKENKTVIFWKVFMIRWWCGVGKCFHHNVEGSFWWCYISCYIYVTEYIILIFLRCGNWFFFLLFTVTFVCWGPLFIFLIWCAIFFFVSR